MIRLHQNIQIVIGLLLALMWGVFAIMGDNGENNIPLESTSTLPVIEQVTPTSTDAPHIRQYETLPNMWMVRFVIYKESSPEIVNVLSLPQGRLSGSVSGDSTLKLLDEENGVIYEVKFTPVFSFGEPPIEHDSVEMILVIPQYEEAKLIEITTPYGVVRHDLE